MEKVILVDGNNLLFRSYYATAYSGNIMRNKEGFPTNGLYGFVNMMNKIIMEEKPKYIMVAFDIGKTFRHEEYEDYKDGRVAMPEDLKLQFPVAKKILNAMGITYLEKEGYEADDIIGTFAKAVDNNKDFIATIISSDRDLLQLISDEVEVKLLKQKDYIRMNKQVFFDTYGITADKMIDLKGLMGDSSDNLPGVKGIGEKTALKLLQEFGTIENLYDNIDNIKGAIHDKLVEGKDSAFMCKKLATIYKEVPIDTDFNNLLYKNEVTDDLINIYNDLGFYSLLKKIELPKNNNAKVEFKIAKKVTDIDVKKASAIYLDIIGENYHHAEIFGMAIYNDEEAIFVPYELLQEQPTMLLSTNKYTYDFKKVYVSLTNHHINFDNFTFDTMISAYLLGYNVKDDILSLANILDYDIPENSKKEELTYEERAYRSILKAKFIYETKDKFYHELETEELLDLYNNIEFPLIKVLAKMELNGITVDKKVLEDMKQDIAIKLELLTKDIYNYAGEEFNISSPKQLGEILFEKLKMPHGKKNKSGYVTDMTVLNKLRDYPITNKILEYRFLSKLYSTYIEGILNAISSDNKIHTIYTQTITRTGRLSSLEPNLQNIPVRSEYGKLIRKAFIPEEDSVIMSSDYSQIELRMFAHLSQIKDLTNAFNNDMDIHTKTAMDIFKVPEEGVTPNMRRKAKAVNFGIIYGISSYGLAEDLDIPVKEAKEFIDTYFNTYPGIKEYMDASIKKAHEEGYVKTIMNRKRTIEELNNSNYNIRSMGERMALNTPIQGSSADILKKAMIEIDEYFVKHNLQSKMLLQVHDELIFNVKKEELEEVKKVVTNIMENTYKLSVPLKVDTNIGINWYEAK